jgi:hypothetical protein
MTRREATLAARTAQRPRRTTTTLFALAAGLVLAAAPAGGQTPVTLTFDALTATDMSGVRPVENCYVESQVRVTVVGEPCGLPPADQPPALATYTPDNFSYTGTPALFNNLGFAVDFAPTGGGVFSLFSIDLAPIFLIGGGPAAGMMPVMFTGTRMGAMTVSQTFDLSLGATALTTFVFSGEFTNLSSVRLEPGAPDYAVQFDNVNAGVVPEPSTFALMAPGLAVLAAVARRRRTGAARPTA